MNKELAVEIISNQIERERFSLKELINEQDKHLMEHGTKLYQEQIAQKENQIKELEDELKKVFAKPEITIKNIGFDN